MGKSLDKLGAGLIVALLAIFGFGCFISFGAGLAAANDQWRKAATVTPPLALVQSPRAATCDLIFDQVDAAQQAEAERDAEVRNQIGDHLANN